MEILEQQGQKNVIAILLFMDSGLKSKVPPTIINYHALSCRKNVTPGEKVETLSPITDEEDQLHQEGASLGMQEEEVYTYI